MCSVILPALKGIVLKNPRVRLHIYTKELNELLPMLKRGESEFIVTDQVIDREEIESIRLGSERNVLVEADKYNGPDIFLDHDEKDETTRQYIKLARKSAKFIERHYLDDVYGIIDGVKLGLGRAILPQHLISGIKGLTIKQKDTVLETGIFLHFFRQPFYSGIHKKILETLIKKAPALLQCASKQY